MLFFVFKFIIELLAYHPHTKQMAMNLDCMGLTIATLLDWTPMFVWYTTWFVVENGH